MPIASGYERWDERTMEIMRNRCAAYRQSEQYDFGTKVMLTFEITDGKEAGDIKAVLLSRPELQKLFDDLHRYGFRPNA